MSAPIREVALVVPTIRESCMKDFLERWDGIQEVVDIHVMEDNPRRTFDIKNVHSHYDWSDISGDLGDDEWVIPRRSDTVRSYAYWKVWNLGYKYVVTLDDDCYPPTAEKDGFEYLSNRHFFDEHLRHLNDKTKWFNTLNSVRPRGFPYFNHGRRKDVVVNHGLWSNVLDYDAPTQLAGAKDEEFSYDSRIVPHWSFFPMCGMNLAWRADCTVLMYHLLMGQGFQRGGRELEKWPFDRFGDIWCGILMKKCLDVLDMSVSTGMPIVRHERASNPFTNLKKEANGIEVNEKFWEYIDGITLEPVRMEVMYQELGKAVGQFDEFPEHKEYFEILGLAMRTWAGLFARGRTYAPASLQVAV